MSRTRAITAQSGATFTLDAPIPGAAPGDQVVIGATFKDNLLSANTVTGGAPAILLYGMAFGNRIEANTVNGSNIKVLSIDNLTVASGSATRSYGRAPSGYNTITNNTVSGSVILEYYVSADINQRPSSYSTYTSYGNNVVGNDCSAVGATEQTCYVTGNTGSNRFSNVTLMPEQVT